MENWHATQIILQKNTFNYTFCMLKMVKHVLKKAKNMHTGIAFEFLNSLIILCQKTIK